MTGQRLNRALHAFHRLYQASTFGGLSNIGSINSLLLSASVKTLKLTRLHAEIVSSWLDLVTFDQNVKNAISAEFGILAVSLPDWWFLRTKSVIGTFG